MKILIVDRDELVVQLLRSKLEPLGHEILVEPVKNDAVDMMANGDYDIVFMDPAPLTSPRPMILNVRRSVKNYPYIFITSDSISHEDAVKAGANDTLKKPLDPNVITEKIDNAERLIKLVRRLGDDSYDFPSAGGVIAKSAINQLFLAAIDRADRYGERTFMLQISLNNYQEMLGLDGPYVADFSVAKLSQYLVLLRRQSDIIGQTEKYEYTLLLQRPIYETEPVEAANRFAEALGKYKDIDGSGNESAEVRVALLDLPAGALLIEHVFKPGEVAPAPE